MTSRSGTREEVVVRWRARHAEWQRFRTRVDGAAVCEEVLRDLTLLQQTEEEGLLNLTEAAYISCYSRETLSRWVKEGKIPNCGRKNSPLVRRCDVPAKPMHLPERHEVPHLTASSKRQIVRSVVAQGKGTR
jgi:hypothetical protein